jgi:regulator of sigma E protease
MDWINIVFWLIGTLVVVLGPMILVHELGHFIFAKLAGVRVEEFGLGYPPRLLKLWRGKGHLFIGSTRVNIPAGFRLPPKLETGAWVDGLTQRRDDGTYLLRRLTVLDPGVDELSPKHEHVDSGEHMRDEVTALEPGTIYSLNLLPLGGFVKMTGEEDPSDPRSLASQPKRWRIAVMAAGAGLNILVALMLLVGAYTTGFPDKWLVKVTGVEAGSAAEEVKLQPHDIIVAAGGERLEQGTEHLQTIIRAAPGETIELTVLRGDETLALMPTLGSGPTGEGYLGIWMSVWPDRSALRRYRLPEALSAGIGDMAATVVATLQVPAQLARGDITPEEARPATVVGISEVLAFTLQQSIEWGIAFPVLHTMSLISLALGLTNLLPIPALDGGRILFVLIEAVRGRRVSPEREALVHFVGLVILISLMTLVMLQDITNPIIPWSWLK